MSVRSKVGAGALLAVLLATSPAMAQQAPTGASVQATEDVASVLSQAQNHYVAGRYADAAAAFERAYALSHQAELLYNIGRAWEQADHLPEALAAYRRCLEAGAPGQDRLTLQETVQRIERQQAERTARQDAEARAAQEAEARRAAEGRFRRVEVRRGWLAEYGPWVLGGVGAVSLTFGLLIGAAASTAANGIPFREINNGTRPWSQEIQNNYRTAVDGNTAAASLFTSAAVFGVASAVWFYFRNPRVRVEFVPIVAVLDRGFSLGLGGTL